METIETVEYRGFIINIHPDYDAPNPRKDFDEVGKMVCFHDRYELGDKHSFSSPDEFMEEIIETGEAKIILSLYLYDHSGITMRTHPFSCPWDSGQVGWIYLDDETIQKEWGWDYVEKHGGESFLEDILKGEVELYDQYLTGQVYGFTIEPTERNREIECNDSVWGFYGDTDYMVSEAKSSIDFAIQEYREKIKTNKQEKREMEKFLSFAWAM